MNVIVDVRAMNVNMHVGGQVAERFSTCLAPKALFMSAWGNAPGFM